MKLRLSNPFDSRPSLIKTPLPGFDPIYYLYWYPDVRAAGLDPLHHYLHHGWKEGRDPSAGFSTLGYLNANPDVAALGHNPLVHFVNNGFAEGRKGFDKDREGPAPKPGFGATPLKLLSPPRSSDPIPLQGFVDEVDHTCVRGWALAPNSSESPAEVQIVIDEAVVGCVTANEFRPDLRDEKIGDAHHGFKFSFEPPLEKSASQTVSIRRSADGFEIGRTVLNPVA